MATKQNPGVANDNHGDPTQVKEKGKCQLKNKIWSKRKSRVDQGSTLSKSMKLLNIVSYSKNMYILWETKDWEKATILK